MTSKLSKLIDRYYNIEKKIRGELDKLSEDECNCSMDNREEIDLVSNDNHEIGVNRYCCNCGGIIWDRAM